MPRRRPVAARTESYALLVIDHQRLQDAAWAEFHTVRKRLDQAARQLHRHENIDVPAFEAWLHRTFPLQVTALRELEEDVIGKSRQIREVRERAAHTGRSLKRLWQERKERAANPEAFREKYRVPRAEEFGRGEASEPRGEARLEDFTARPSRKRTAAARELYRRLVQRIHPDRGGAWTPARQNLWHEVQQAWAAGDSDWLARLEVEWETAHEEVGPGSPLSRLRSAIEELHAARRDIEHKLRAYRTSPPWRFTRRAAVRAALERRVEADLVHEYKRLRRQLDHLNATIAAWEEDWTRAGGRASSHLTSAARAGLRRSPGGR